MSIKRLLFGTKAATPIVAFLLLCASAFAQRADDSGSRHAESVHAVRHICDPHTGMQWILERDYLNPGGPGLLIPADDIEQSCHRGPSKATQETSHTTSKTNYSAGTLPLAIHSGDRLVIEEITSRLETRLEAIALNSASIGQELNARLTFQSTSVRVVALGPGRATFARGLGARQ